MVSVPLPTLRRPKDTAVALSIAGRTVAIVLRMRPIAPLPVLAGYTVLRDEAPSAVVLSGEAGNLRFGWWIELLTGDGSQVLGGMRLVKTSDLWTAHRAYLQSTIGAHLLLSCTATPGPDKPLSVQCEIELTPDALA